MNKKRREEPDQGYVGAMFNGSLHMYKRQTPRMVRFADPHPTHQPEAFCYSLLLQHVSVSPPAAFLPPPPDNPALPRSSCDPTPAAQSLTPHLPLRF